MSPGPILGKDWDEHDVADGRAVLEVLTKRVSAAMKDLLPERGTQSYHCLIIDAEAGVAIVSSGGNSRLVANAFREAASRLDGRPPSDGHEIITDEKESTDA